MYFFVPFSASPGLEIKLEGINLQGWSGHELSLNSVRVAHLLVVPSRVTHLHEVSLNTVNLHTVHIPLY